METNRLYHYCKLTTAIEYILPDKQLLFNPIGKTNDPRENQSFVFAGLNIHASDNGNFNDRNTEISDEIRKDCKMLCLSRDVSPYFGYELSRMWALYGDHHKGVCIELDKEKFLRENHGKIKDTLFKPVTYYKLDVSKPILHREIDFERIDTIGLTDYVRKEFRPKNTDYLFYTKNKEWESEQEYRLVYFSDKTENEYCKINTCIENIFLGVDFNDQYLPAIKQTCDRVNIYKLEYRDVRLVASKKLE